MLIKSCFLKKNTKEIRRYVSSLSTTIVTIKLNFYYSNLKNVVETAKIAVDSCYVLQQFLTPLPLFDFREI